jgi:hypothetical protein
MLGIAFATHMTMLFRCLLLSVLVSLAGCSKSKSSSQPDAAGATAANAATSASAKATPTQPTSFPIPVGPPLGIFAGESVGPIYFGATVKTIERHMLKPCEILTESKCRYITRAVEFELKDGVVSAIYVHRHDRPANPGTYGVFNGGIPPDLRFGMYAWAIQEHLGKPKRVEKVLGKNPFNTEERHYYEGLVLDYDRLPNGNLVLGGARVVKK